MNWLRGKKTYIVAGLMALVALVRFLTGDLSFPDFILSDSMRTLLEAAGLSALRAGVAKGASASR